MRQGQRFLYDEQDAVSRRLGEQQQVAEQQGPVLADVPALYSAEIAAENPLAPRLIQYKRLEEITSKNTRVNTFAQLLRLANIFQHSPR